MAGTPRAAMAAISARSIIDCCQRVPTVCLHSLVLRAAAPLGRHPRNHLIRIHDVARLAMDAVGRVYLESHAAALAGHDFVDVCGTEANAGMTVLRPANRMTHL